MAELVWSQTGRDGLVEKRYRCRCGGDIWANGWWDTRCGSCHRPHNSAGQELNWNAPCLGYNGFGDLVDGEASDW